MIEKPMQKNILAVLYPPFGLQLVFQPTGLMAKAFIFTSICYWPGGM